MRKHIIQLYIYKSALSLNTAWYTELLTNAWGFYPELLTWGENRYLEKRENTLVTEMESANAKIKKSVAYIQ
jgi:hypothetical protein